MRETSLDAYRAIRDSGILTNMQFEAYSMLHEHGPLTGSEMDDLAKNPSFHKRVSELEAAGVVVTQRLRICRVTGLLVHEWQVTGMMPQKVSRQAPPRPKVKQILAALSFMRAMYKLAVAQKIEVPEGFIAVARWLSWKVRKIVSQSNETDTGAIEQNGKSESGTACTTR